MSKSKKETNLKLVKGSKEIVQKSVLFLLEK